jgi:hypothetical protein
VDLAFQWTAQLRHLTVMHVAIAASMGAEFAGRAYGCSAGLPPPLLAALARLMPTVQIFQPGGFVVQLLRSPGQGCVMRGDSMLEFFHAKPDFWPAAGVLLAYLWATQGLALGALALVARRGRR